MLDRLLQDAEAKARMSSALEILILQALALYAQEDRTTALSTLERALTLAAPEGYIRLFIDEGVPMLALLRHLHPHTRDSMQDYVAMLLSTFGETVPSLAARHVPSPNALPEPLTAREYEVLQLLLEGASNREIAHRLVLSINT